MVGTQENIPDTVGTAAKTENTTGADLDRAAFGKAGEEEETGDGLEEREKEKREGGRRRSGADALSALGQLS